MQEEEIDQQDQQEPTDGQSVDPSASLQQERDEYLEGWKRAKADYENLIKETDKNRASTMQWANEQVLLRLLPALDQYEVALQFTPSLETIPVDVRKPFESWIIGLEAVRSLWHESAKELGLTMIIAKGAFDPGIHEAMSEELHESIPKGEIIRSVMNGYALNGKVIRCAKVIVSKGT